MIGSIDKIDEKKKINKKGRRKKGIAPFAKYLSSSTFQRIDYIMLAQYFAIAKSRNQASTSYLQRDRTKVRVFTRGKTIVNDPQPCTTTGLRID